MLKFSDHRFLCSADYLFEEPERYYIIMPFIKGSMIENFAAKNWVKKHIPENLARFFIMQIVIAVGYLHESNVLHGDLQMSNILVDE